MNFLNEVKAIEKDMIGARRRIHQRPELAYHEAATAAFVAKKLQSLGIETATGAGETGVLGVLKGARRGKVVALRADMDALPVQEQADVEFKSRVNGVMHACGHDSHVAMLLAAATVLAAHREELQGTVKFLFQPAEEHGGRGGAKPMIEAGVMENPHVNFVFGLHISNRLPSGSFGVRAGPAMAAPDTFRLKIRGRGGHGSAPHETVDPVYVAAHVILALQGVSARAIDPVKPFVISVGSIHSGTKENIIPDDAMLEGTIRTLDEQTRRRAKAKVDEVSKAVSKAFGATCDVSFEEDAYPVTVNDPAVTEKVAGLLSQIPGTKVVQMDPLLGGEDFSRFLQKAPGTFYYLGTRNPRKDCVYPNHSSRFKIDEDVLKYGAASLALLATEFTKGEA